jgi:tRNA(Ile)-lysidine synthase
MPLARVELSSEGRALLSADGSAVVVAVSGGSDSVALVHLLNDAYRAGAGPPLRLAHLNHRIRGGESDRDALFVRELADSLILPVTVGECDVPSAAKERRISIELAARECRYEFLERVARESCARCVALGHTADDQVETIFHNLLRGAGIHGLAGMPRTRPIAPGSDVRIVRPLLDCSRQALMNFLASRNQPWRTDHTNLDTTYTRNRIRHRLIPALVDSWPDLRDDLADFTRELSALDTLLNSIASEWLDARAGAASSGVSSSNLKSKIQNPKSPPASISVALVGLQSLDEPLHSYVIRDAVARVLGDLRRIDEVHVRMIADLASAGTTGSSLDLPRGLLVRRDYDLLSFEKREFTANVAAGVSSSVPSNPKSRIQNLKSPPEAFEIIAPALSPLSPAALPVPGAVRWGSWVIETEIVAGEQIPEEMAKLCASGGGVEPERRPSDAKERMRELIALLRKLDPAGVKYLDLDRVGGAALSVRSRVPGDRFTPLGSPGQTKLKDYLIRRKVPHADRDALPLIVSPTRILLVSTLGVDNACALADDTARVLKVTCSRLQQGG